MSEFPRKVFIHAPGDLGQVFGHHEPRDGYNANVEYVRADLAAEGEREWLPLSECDIRIGAVVWTHLPEDYNFDFVANAIKSHGADQIEFRRKALATHEHNEGDDSRIAQSTERRKAPWPDFYGNDIYEGDVLSHPSGETGAVRFLPDEDGIDNQWRVDYRDRPGDRPMSRLCLQVGDKGRAVLERYAQITEPHTKGGNS